MNWTFLLFEGAIGHTVAGPFVELVKADLMARSCGELQKEVAKDTAFLDRGGPCIMGEPKEIVEVDGLTVEVPVSQVASFIDRARRAEVRSDGYVKIHGRWSCIVCSPVQREMLVDALADVVDRAEASYAEFSSKWAARFDEAVN